MKNQDNPQSSTGNIVQLRGNGRATSTSTGTLTVARAKPPTDWWGVGKLVAFKVVVKEAVEKLLELVFIKRRRRSTAA